MFLDDEEEALDDPPALLIMEESETEQETQQGASPDLSPERLRDERGFTRRESIVYRHSSDDSDEDCDRAMNKPASPVKALERPKSSLENRFNNLCGSNGISRMPKRKAHEAEFGESVSKFCKFNDSVPNSILPPHVDTSEESVESKHKKSHRDSKRQKSKCSIDKKGTTEIEETSSSHIPPLFVKPDDKASTELRGLKLTLKKQRNEGVKKAPGEYVITNMSAAFRNGVAGDDTPALPSPPLSSSDTKKSKKREDEGGSSSGSCSSSKRKKSKKSTKPDKYRTEGDSAVHTHPYAAGLLPYSDHQKFRSPKSSEWFSGSNLYHHTSASQPPLVHPIHHIPASLHHPSAALHRGPATAAAIPAAPPASLLTQATYHPRALPPPSLRTYPATNLYPPPRANHSYY